ncbi:MAG TPA: hypothetical protein VK558_02660 [Patescibacteria group bacterium]|nr:hypothetical protein [Patescibacteria group bacterium]
MTDVNDLDTWLQRATGADPGLDAAIVVLFGVPPGDYTASIEKCRFLLTETLPGWQMHLGYDVSGVFPYAAVSNGGRRLAADGPTVPLAILRAVVRALSSHSASAVEAGGAAPRSRTPSDRIPETMEQT